MNTEYFTYFNQFFNSLWVFLTSNVPVLNLPWIVLFGSGFIITVVMNALNHLIGFSINGISGKKASDKVKGEKE